MFRSAVNFAWNSFGDKGTQALAKALEQNMYLESLDLSANHIAGATVMVSLRTAAHVVCLLRVSRLLMCCMVEAGAGKHADHQ